MRDTLDEAVTALEQMTAASAIESAMLVLACAQLLDAVDRVQASFDSVNKEFPARLPWPWLKWSFTNCTKAEVRFTDYRKCFIRNKEA